jgi:hypothetical protein
VVGGHSISSARSPVSTSYVLTSHSWPRWKNGVGAFVRVRVVVCFVSDFRLPRVRVGVPT